MSESAQSSLHWPSHLERTPPRKRDSGRKFDTTISKGFDGIERQLRLMGASSHEYYFDAQKRQDDGRPYHNATPDDPGFVLEWTVNNKRYVVACDQYEKFAANVRAIGLWLKENRMTDQRPVQTGQSQLAAALPPGEMGSESVVAPEEPPHEVLGVRPAADPEVVDGAARQLKGKYHPDSGSEPDEEQFKKVVKAEERMANE